MLKQLASRFYRKFKRPQYSDYLMPVFLKHIKKARVNTIFELGGRDGLDALALRRYFRAQVWCFECNPQAIQLCRAHLESKKGVHLVEKAVWNKPTDLTFYPVIESTWADGRPVLDGAGQQQVNIGASSCFRARDDYLQQYAQTEISVRAIRLGDYCRDNNIEQIDLLCIDVQGAALHALQGLGQLLRSVSYIMVELEHRPIYQGQSMYAEVHDYLVDNGFKQVAHVPRDAWFNDYLYVRAK